MRFPDVARIVVLALVVAVWILPTAKAFELDGNWNFVFDTEDGIKRAPATLQVSGEQVSGTFGTSDVQGTFTGDKIDLKFPFYSVDAGFESELHIEGGVEGDGLGGDWQFGEYSGTWTATRAAQ